MRSPWVPCTGTGSRDSSEPRQSCGYFYTLSPEAVRSDEKDSQTARPQHLLELLKINSAPVKLTVSSQLASGSTSLALEFNTISMETDADRFFGELKGEI